MVWIVIYRLVWLVGYPFLVENQDRLNGWISINQQDSLVGWVSFLMVALVWIMNQQIVWVSFFNERFDQ